MKKRLLIIGAISAAFIFAMMVTSQTSDAMGKGKSFCVEKVKLDGEVPVTVKTSLKSTNDVPLSRTTESMVDNGTAFTGGKAEDIALIVNPMPGVWTFESILLHANSDCEFTGDPIQVKFTGQAPIDIDDDSLKPDNNQAVYEGAQAVAGWPNSAYNSDEEELAQAICQEVKDNLSNPVSSAGVNEMLTAARVATAAGLAAVEEAQCLATANVTTIVEGGAGCTVNDLLANSAMLTTRLDDIEAFGPVTISLSSEGTGDVSFELDDGDGNCTSCTIDLTPPDVTDCMALDCGDC